MNKIHNSFESHNYAEEVQALKVKFAYITQILPNEYRTLHNYVNCRDFLSDVIYWHYNNLPHSNVYGFSIKEEDYPLLSPIFAIKASPQLLDNLQTNLTIPLFKGLKIYNTEDATTRIIHFSSSYLYNPVNISFLTLAIKLLAAKKAKTIPELVANKNLPQKEKSYLTKIGHQFFADLMASPHHLPSTHLQFSPEISKWSLGQLHDFLGIVSMFSAYSPDSLLKREFQKLKQQSKILDENNNSKNNFYPYDPTSYRTPGLVSTNPSFAPSKKVPEYGLIEEIILQAAPNG